MKRRNNDKAKHSGTNIATHGQPAGTTVVLRDFGNTLVVRFPCGGEYYNWKASDWLTEYPPLFPSQAYEDWQVWLTSHTEQ